jgi:RND family efflux transporter MFP subunit
VGPVLVLALGMAMVVGPGRLRAADAIAVTEPFFDVQVSAPVAGIVTAHKYHEGDFVKEGQVMIELDKRIEELEVERRRIVLETKQKDFEATQTLFKTSKSVSKEELDKKESEFKVAKVELDGAEEQLRRRSVTAPISGVITEIQIDPGEACQPYQPILRLVDTRRAYIVANLEASMTARLKLNDTLTATLVTGTSTVTVNAKVSFISPVVDPASGLHKIKAIFENPDGGIRPGITARIQF